MFRRNRGLAGAIRHRRAFAPGQESLETRRLLATTVELSTTQSANLGTELIGANAGAGAGYTVTDVGDVTGSGYDSYVVAAPSTTTGSDLGSGGSAIYLVFGTKSTTSTTATGIANLTSALRGGDLASLGLTGGTQVNPTAVPTSPATPGFQFDGLKFVTGLDTTTGLGRATQLGASVTALGDINGDGYADFMVGAPGDTGGGREFLIYGGPQLTNQTNKNIDLEPIPGIVNGSTPTKVVSFYNSTGADFLNQVGTSAAGVRNFFANNGQGLGNATDLAIGDPLATNTSGISAGAVYVLSGALVNTLATGTSVDLATVGTTNGIGLTLQGTSQGDRTGFSLAAAGSLDLTASTTAGGPNLLIGAPGTIGLANSGGRAYLVASTQLTPSLLSVGTTLSLATLGTVPTTTIPITLTGDVFVGTISGGQLGYAVSSATDLNLDGVADIALGAPGIFASSGSTAGNGFVAIVYDPENTFAGQATTTTNVYAIAPATTSTNTIGTAYYTGATFGDQAGYSLSPVYLASNFSGSSRGLLIGSPGYNLSNGTAYYIPAATSATTITPTTPVVSDLPTASLFQFTLTPSLTSSAAPAIGSTSYLGNSVSARPLFSADSGSTTGDFFFGAPGFSLSNPSAPSAILRSLSGAEFTVSAAALPGNSSGGGTTPVTPIPGVGSIVATPFNSTFGVGSPVFTGQFAGEPYPTISSLEHKSSYQPLPARLAYQQFRPAPGFAAREENYHNPGKGKSHQAPTGTILGVPQLGVRGQNKYNKVFTLPTKIFRRGKYHAGTPLTYTHPGKVIPRSQQTERYPG